MSQVKRRDNAQARITEVIDGAVSPLLTGSGFIKSDSEFWQMHRVLEQRIDILELIFADIKGGTPYGLTKHSFAFIASVFIKGIPHPMGAQLKGIADEPIHNASGGHFYLRILPNRLFQGIRSQGFWRIGGSSLMTRLSIANAVSALRAQALPWFDSFSQLQDVLRDSEQALRQKKFGRSWRENIRSPDLVLGFLSLKLKDWTLARLHLEKALSLKNPVHTLDPAEPELLYASLRPEITAGIELSKQNGP